MAPRALAGFSVDRRAPTGLRLLRRTGADGTDAGAARQTGCPAMNSGALPGLAQKSRGPVFPGVSDRPCRKQSAGESGVDGGHAKPPDFAFEAGAQSWRHDLVVHHIGDGSSGRCLGREFCAVPGLRGPCFETGRPPQGTGMMDGVAGQSMFRGNLFMPAHLLSPYPLAGRVGAGGGRATPGGTEKRDNEC
jgi:hypothetical protein